MEEKARRIREEGGTLRRLLAPSLKLRYGASIETLTRIEEDDDWSFVIKLHALLEAAMTAVLAGNLDSRLKRLVGALDLGDVENGKLAWIAALELLLKEELDFVRFFSQIRNKAAHDIREADFTFSRWVSSLDDSKIRRYRAVTVPLLGDKIIVDGKVRLTAERAIENPRITMLGCAISVLIGVQVSLWTVETGLGQSIPKESKTNHPQ